MKTRIKYFTIFFLAFCCIIGASNAGVTEDARNVWETHKEAIVTVQLVIEATASYGGESSKREYKVSCTATVIDPSGLMVSSLSSINPSDAFNSFDDEDDEVSVSTKVVDVKVKFSDGSEVSADVVLRDRDLDLAFIRLKKAPEKPLSFVDLSQANVPQLLDELVLLSRLGAIGNRELAATLDRVRAVVTKPRTFYVINGMFFEFGMPAFALDGKPAGILVLRTSPNKDGGEIYGSMSNSMLAVVLPCSTVANVAEQAMKAKPEKE